MEKRVGCEWRDAGMNQEEMVSALEKEEEERRGKGRKTYDFLLVLLQTTLESLDNGIDDPVVREYGQCDALKSL
jgi:hypothetical protein